MWTNGGKVLIPQVSASGMSFRSGPASDQLPFRSGPAFLPSAMGKETRRDGADLVLAQSQTTAGEDAPKPGDKKPL